MRLLITDVTEMHGSNYCVAGWCNDEQRMIRPLPNGANWTTRRLEMHGVVPGATVVVEPSGMPAGGSYPHRTEDTPIDPASISLVHAGPTTWFGPAAPPTAATLAEAFEGTVVCNRIWNGVGQGAHVQTGTEARSLWAVEVARERLRFVEDYYGENTRLKAILDDGSARYRLAVASRTLKGTWRQGELKAVDSALPSAGTLHIRVGLARAWGAQPDKCYVMINGVYW